MTSTTLDNRQYNPLHALCSGVTFVQASSVMHLLHHRVRPTSGLSLLQECANILQRRSANKPDEVWLQSAMYPSCEHAFTASCRFSLQPRRQLHLDLFTLQIT